MYEGGLDSGQFGDCRKHTKDAIIEDFVRLFTIFGARNDHGCSSLQGKMGSL